MKKIFCPKCDSPITLTQSKLLELREAERGVGSVVCPTCTHQLRLKMRPRREQATSETIEACGHLTVLENVFGFKQYFALKMGLNGIGRRNKDTETDIPIITSDPSMDRHHAIIKVSRTKAGRLIWALADNDSRVGTFVANELLGPKEWYNLSDGDIFTLGATTLIFSTAPLPIEEDTIASEGVH